MFVYAAEIMIFMTVLWITWYSFANSKESTKINDMNFQEIVTELNGAMYTNIQINSNLTQWEKNVYKEVVIEFKDGDLNSNLCNFLNNNS